MTSKRSEQEACVIVLMPGARDAERSVQMLSEARILSRVCPRVSELSAEFSRGAGAVLLTEEIVWADQSGDIERALRMQEPWSMIPLLLISRDGGTESLQKTVLERYPGVTVLEKPVRPRALVGAVQSALRARANQLQVRELLRDRERQSAELAEQDEKLRAALDAVSKQAEQLRNSSTVSAR